MEPRFAFKLPEKKSGGNENDENENYADRVSTEIMKQVSAYPLLPNETAATIAAELIEFCREAPPHIAFHILHQAYHHQRLQNKEVRQTIKKAKTNAKSPLITNATFPFLTDYQARHAIDTNDLLQNPERLLAWFQNASSLDTALLIARYFKIGTEHWRVMKEKAGNECNDPGYATICYYLTDRELSADHAQSYLIFAMGKHPDFYDKYTRVALSIHARMLIPDGCCTTLKIYEDHVTCMLRQASGCFIHHPQLAIREAALENMQMDGAILNNSQLPSANLSRSSLVRAELRNCIFTHANFSHADLSRARLQGAKLNESTMVACLLDHARMNDCELNFANLTGANLSFAMLQRAKLCKANLTSCNLNNADLTDANLSGAILINADLRNAYLTKDTILTNTVFFNMSSFESRRKLEMTFDRMAAMLKDHAFAEQLRTAILSDLLKHMRSRMIADSNVIKILQLAFNHPLFGGPASYLSLTSMANMASPVVGFFSAEYSSSVNKQPTQLVETPEQTIIRDEINAIDKNEKEERDAFVETRVRPPMPTIAPSEVERRPTQHK